MGRFVLIILLLSSFSKGKFSKKPSVFITAAHHHAGLKRDAASIWIEDITQSSFKICLRELQNYAGSHEDIYVVSAVFFMIVYFSLTNTTSLRLPIRDPLHFFRSHKACVFFDQGLFLILLKLLNSNVLNVQTFTLLMY